MATALWVGLGESFEQLRGEEPYSRSKSRYLFRFAVTGFVLVAGFILITSLTRADQFSPLAYPFFLFFMKGKVLVLFEPLFDRGSSDPQG